MFNSPSTSHHLLQQAALLQQRLPNLNSLTISRKSIQYAATSLPPEISDAVQQCAKNLLKGDAKEASIVSQRLLHCKDIDRISSEVTRQILNQKYVPMLQQRRTFKTRATSLGVGSDGVSADKQEQSMGKLASMLPGNQRSAKKMMEKLAPMPANSEKLDSLLDKIQDDKVKGNMKEAYYDGYMQGVIKMAGNIKQQANKGTFEKVFWIFVLSYLIYYMYTSGSLRLPGSKRFEVDEETTVGVSFDDVRGINEAREDLQEVVDYLRQPEKYSALGARLPKGVLLVGSPGTGKTLLARAIAGEAGVPFFRASGSEFDEMLVGLGAARMRQLFEAAKAKSPCVIFIDEIDSVGASRVSTSIHPYANQTINQLLNEMDGFERNEGIIVIGATNRRDDLDKALLRPGRFDLEITVPRPDKDGRVEIFRLYLDKVLIADDVEIDALAKQTVGLTGAEIENLVNTAALRAATDGYARVHMMHLEEARDRIAIGRHRKGGRLPDEESNKITAYHEAGHTLVAHYNKNSIPIHKVTITPRGHALGHTAFLPVKDEVYETKAQLLARLDCAMGGRVAEELIFGSEKVTTGAASDFHNATIIAQAMVMAYGMSAIGTRDLTLRSPDNVTPAVSPALQESVDTEIKTMLAESYNRAKAVLTAHAKEHHALASALLEHETLDATQIQRVIEGKPAMSAEEKDARPKPTVNEAQKVISKLPPKGSRPTTPISLPLNASERSD